VSLRAEKAKLLRMEDIATRLPTIPNAALVESIVLLGEMPHQVEVFGH
jgi:hypothetical protein